MNKKHDTGKVYLNIKQNKCYKCQDLVNGAWCTKRYDNVSCSRDYKSENLDKDKDTDMTLNYYNKNAIKFTEETLSVQFEERQDMFLKYLKPGAYILDLGCGSGRDSKAFIQKGYKVVAMDGSSELCKIASKNIGQKVICGRFQDLNKMDVFDGVWACASILHIPSVDLHNVIYNIFKALKSGGYFYTSFKYGNFEGERNGRYFTDLTEESLKSLLKPFKALEIIEVTITSDVRPGRENEKWLNAIIKKN